MKKFTKHSKKLGILEIIVDDQDAWLLEQYSWNTRQSKRHSTPYVEGMNAKTSGPYRNKKLHRVIMNPKNNEVVDHVNGNGLDNRRENLRVCKQYSNVQNAKKLDDKATSKFKGVSYNNCKGYRGKKRWRAQLQFNGKKLTGGWHLTEEDAARAYDTLALKYFGEFAYLNFSKNKVI